MSNEERALYNCIDAAVTMKVWNEIKGELTDFDPPYKQCYDQTMDLYGPTIFMSTRGLKVDIEALEEEKVRVTDLIDSKQEELDALTNGQLNPTSPKSCQAYFYGKLGLQPYLKQGRPTTDDTALARIARRGHREASLCQEIRRAKKLFSTYLDVRVDPDGRIRASWNLRGTREGRLSSSENIFGTGLNFQNLHPQFKDFIVADDGYMFVEIDKRQAEWIVTAYLSGDARMIEVIESSLDPHIHTAHLITGAPKELLEKEVGVVGLNTDPDLIFQLRNEGIPELLEAAHFLPRSMSSRQMGKKGNHGLNYRLGYRTFALYNELPEGEAEGIVNAYRDVYCNLPIWWDATENELRRNRVMTNCFGRVRRFMGEWNDELIRSAIAFRPQSTVVDLLNRGMIKIYNDDTNFVRPMELGAQVHDSALFQYPVGKWKSMAKCILRFCEYLNPTMEYGGRQFQIPSDIKAGLSWGASSKRGMSEIPKDLPLFAAGSDEVSGLARELERLYDEKT